MFWSINFYVYVSFSQSFDSDFPIRSHVAPSSSATPSQPNTPQNAATSGPKGPKTPVTTVKTPSTLEKAKEFKTRGNACVKAHQFQKAIHYYTEAIRLNKFDAIYFSNRAHCYLKLNRYLECVEDCTIAIGLDENCLKAYYRRMQAHEKLEGNLTAALSDCETVLRFEPKNSEAKNCLKRIKSALKNQKEPAVSVSKSQIENENILLRASSGDGPIASVPTVETSAAAWSKYEGQNDYERIDFILKPPHLRSKQSLKRIEITETSSCMGNGAGDAPLIDERDSPGKTDENAADASAIVVHSGLAADTKNVIDVTDVQTETKASTPQPPPPPTPRTTAQFHKTWLATNSDQQKYAILKVNEMIK